ncbi:hypothetical protein ACFL2H_06435 [Planctomycetota bacterium]
MILRKILQQQPQFAEILHAHQMRVVDDCDEHLAAAIQSESLFDEFAFAFRAEIAKFQKLVVVAV